MPARSPARERPLAGGARAPATRAPRPRAARAAGSRSSASGDDAPLAHRAQTSLQPGASGVMLRLRRSRPPITDASRMTSGSSPTMLLEARASGHAPPLGERRCRRPRAAASRRRSLAGPAADHRRDADERGARAGAARRRPRARPRRRARPPADTTRCAPRARARCARPAPAIIASIAASESDPPGTRSRCRDRASFVARRSDARPGRADDQVRARAAGSASTSGSTMPPTSGSFGASGGQSQ